MNNKWERKAGAQESYMVLLGFRVSPPQTDSSHKPLMLLARGPGFGEPLPSVVGKDEVVGIS